MRERLLHAPELLDEAAHDSEVLEHSLDHVAQVNRFLGGERAVLAALEPLLTTPAAQRPQRAAAQSGAQSGAQSAAQSGAQSAAPLRILDIGSASADIPRAIARVARAKSADIRITATDLHPQMRAIAAHRCRGFPEIAVEEADALSLPYEDGAYDVALLAMTLHHFEDEAPVRALSEAGRVARRVIVSELERGWLNYAGARLLAATWWRFNPLTRHDGPLSVRRAFTAAELHALARMAGLSDIVVERRWFCRLLLTADGAAS